MSSYLRSVYLVLLGLAAGVTSFTAFEKSGILAGLIGLFTMAFVLAGFLGGISNLWFNVPRVFFSGGRLAITSFFLILTYSLVTGHPSMASNKLVYAGGVALLSVVFSAWVARFWP